MLDIYKYSENEKKPIDINGLIRKIVKFINNQLKIKNVALDLHLQSYLPEILGWERQLHQVILNLILNASESIIKKGKIWFTTTATEDAILIEVKDNGKGIASEDIAHIFDAFFSTKKNTGVGLGLFVCKGLIENHGGTIAVASEQGRGTTFTITLPFKHS